MADDALSKVLGSDRGHIRGFGFGVTRSKLSLFSQQDHKFKVWKRIFEDEGRNSRNENNERWNDRNESTCVILFKETGISFFFLFVT